MQADGARYCTSSRPLATTYVQSGACFERSVADKSLPYFRFPTPNFADEREGLSASDGCNHNVILLLEQLVPQWSKGPIARSSNGDG